MGIQVKLKDLIEEMEAELEDSASFLNVKTGEIVGLMSEDLRAAEDEEPMDDLPDWQQEVRMLAEDIVENAEDYLELPSKYEVNEYEIMESFCFTVNDQTKRESLLRAIKGKGAFRRFRDKIIDLEVENQWYSYRKESYAQIAKEWCQEHQLNFIE